MTNFTIIVFSVGIPCLMAIAILLLWVELQERKAKKEKALRKARKKEKKRLKALAAG